MKNFLAKPVTWGGYFKLCGIFSVIAVVSYAIGVVYIWRDELTEWAAEKMALRRLNKVIDHISKKSKRCKASSLFLERSV